jgi:lupus La protein
LQAKLENFFNQYGRCNAVRMRRDESKLFKGSVFAEFADFSSVKKFLDLDPKPEWEGTPLITMSKCVFAQILLYYYF